MGAIFSTEVKAIKPSERPLLSALEVMGVSPDEALFVSDCLERDILPAKKLGMSTCLVGSSGGDTGADFHVRTIAELAR